MSDFGKLKGAVLAQWILLVASSISGTFEAKGLPSALKSFRSNPNYNFHDFQSMAIVIAAIIAFVAYLVSSIGLLKRWKWSRNVYLLSNIIGPVLALFLGPLVMAPGENLLGSMNVVLIGVTIGILYFSPVKEAFR